MERLNCVTLNIRGLCVKGKRESLFRYLETKNVNVAFLQETYCTQQFEQTFCNGWNGQVFHSFTDTSHGRGVCIMINSNVQYQLISKYCDNDGRKMIVNIKINDDYFSLISIYCPNKEGHRIEFIKQLTKCVQEKSISPENVLIGGDFNCVISKMARKRNNADRGPTHLKSFIEKLALIDV
jgi:exonuclease III